MTVKETLKYRKVERTPQVGKDAGKKKYYATAVQDRTMEFEDFVTHIAEHNSPYSRGTVHGVLMDTLDCLQELILDGKSVRFSDLGLFSLGMSSRGEETASKVTAQSIEGVHLILRNTKGWSNAELKKKCRIELLDNHVTVEDGTADGSGNGGTTPTTPSGGSDSKGDNTGQGGGTTEGGGSTEGGGTGSSGNESGPKEF
ncbi:MAG: hypothetical protein JTJ09_04405 [Enterococcus sp.]|nr:hypothetical protein [Enterococcus sp.]